MSDLKVMEVEYSELASTAYKNYKVGIKIQTDPINYQQDFAILVAEVKSKLNTLVDMNKKKKGTKK